jgi:hypothetical protein
VDANELKGLSKVGVFDVESPIESRFVRLRAFAIHGHGQTALELKALEFFGTLIAGNE